jgi:squalene cyclase
MTPAERQAYRQALRSAATQEVRIQIRDRMREELRRRALERGVELAGWGGEREGAEGGREREGGNRVSLPPREP